MDESWVDAGDSADDHQYLAVSDSVPDKKSLGCSTHVSVVTCINVFGYMMTNVYLRDCEATPTGLFKDAHVRYPGHIKCNKGFMNGEAMEQWVEEYFLPDATQSMGPADLPRTYYMNSSTYVCLAGRWEF